MSEIFPNHLKYYTKVSATTFWRLKDLLPENVDSFKIDYDVNKKKEFIEQYYVETTLYEKLTDSKS